MDSVSSPPSLSPDSIVCSGKLIINDDDTLISFIGPLPSIVSIYSIKSLQPVRI